MYHKSKINTKSSNYSKRNSGIEVDTIVIHYTQLGFKDSYFRKFLLYKRETSPQFSFTCEVCAASLL